MKTSRMWWTGIIGIVLLFLAMGLAMAEDPPRDAWDSPLPTPTYTPTGTRRPTGSPIPTGSNTPASTGSPIPTATGTPTAMGTQAASRPDTPTPCPPTSTPTGEPRTMPETGGVPLPGAMLGVVAAGVGAAMGWLLLRRRVRL